MATLGAMFRLYDNYSRVIDRISNTTVQATNRILNASTAADRLNGELGETERNSNRASNGMGRLIKTLIGFAGLKKSMDIVDNYTNTNARLGLINDGLQTQLELQDKIFAAADRSRGVYSDMASAIAKMGLTAGDSFGSNNELIAFTELVQKSFKVGGANQMEQSSAMLQLTQAMGAGRLQGDEFRSITENAPMIANAIAQYIGKPRGELKSLAADGLITADIIKKALFAAATDIEDKFSKMPMTFGDFWNKIKNGALRAFRPIIEGTSRLINNASFIKSVDMIINSLYILASVVGTVLGFIGDNWEALMPLFLAFTGTILTALITKLWMVVAPLMVINWQVFAVFAAIGVVIGILMSLGVTFQDVFKFVGSTVGAFGAFFYNIFIFIWNAVADFINFLGNVFNNPLASIIVLFSGWAITILGFIENVAKGIEDLLNKIPGVSVNITSGIGGLKDRLEANANRIRNENDLKEFVKTKDFMDLSDGARLGRLQANSLYYKMEQGFAGLNNLTGEGLGLDLSNFGTSNNPLNVTSKDKLKVDISKENLQYLRDIAERDYVNKFSTATLAPQIKIEFGDVHEEADADKVAGRIKKILQEEIAMVSEGSYA